MALSFPRRTASPTVVLGVVLLAVLAITVETTVINVALPTLNTDLGCVDHPAAVDRRRLQPRVRRPRAGRRRPG